MYRTQLSLYVPEAQRVPIEAARQLLDPIQAKLIPAHVTLCREDELLNAELNTLRSKLAEARATSVTLTFGAPEYFHEHGVLLPCIGGEPEFQALRRWVLGENCNRNQKPHITLAHPRNPKASANTSVNASALPSGLVVTFTGINHIQQLALQPWEVLEHFVLPPAIAATPNPSIERTLPGKPVSASHVKR